jgi:poly(3-hydroxyalkanoate) synthetase
VGVNLAATPGAVVYRSELIELIQYGPQVNRVHAVPLLFCPPWINKYYIMDLAPGRSLIEWTVQHGHTCFGISYRNPDATMRDLDFEDYLRQGPLDAVRVVREITGAARSTPSRSVSGPADRDRAGSQRRDRRSLDQVRHVPEHPHRLHRSTRPRRLY